MSAVLRQMMSDSPVALVLCDELVTGNLGAGGLTFRDLSGNGNHCTNSSTLLGQPLLGATKGVTLNGSTQTVNRDETTGSVTGMPVGSAARTLVALVYPTSATNPTVVSYGLTGASDNAGFNEHTVFEAPTSPGAYWFTDGVNVSNNKTSVGGIPINAPSYIAMTYAGGAAGAALFYVNGVLDTTTTLTLNTAASPNRFRGGWRSDSGRATGFLTGRIACCGVYSTALTAARILAHYRAMLMSGVTF